MIKNAPICGVYKIQNIINKKVYIGSSKNIIKRWKNHELYLNKNSHYVKELQEDYNKYGKDSFKFEILENVEKEEDLRNKERFYIDKYNAIKEGYNKMKIHSNKFIISEDIRFKLLKLKELRDDDKKTMLDMLRFSFINCLLPKEINIYETFLKHNELYNKYDVYKALAVYLIYNEIPNINTKDYDIL